MHSLNLGILAHIDAGKTSLTERLLHAAGVIDEIGSVDQGSTTTDSLALEKQRGITIKSAVVSFALPGPLGGPQVNLIDTPGHPDFIAEVERVLGVLDGAVLVVSAVEGVQPQTRILMRTLRRLRIPTLIFVNKLDRRGADLDRTLDAVRRRLTPDIVPMTGATEQGTRQAAAVPYTAADRGFGDRLVDLLARRDDRLLAAYVDDESAVDHARLRAALAEQTAASLVHPVYAGSAVTGAGTDALIAGIAELLPARCPDPAAPVAGSVFKMERGTAGERIAYVRVAAGTVRTRDRLPVHRGGTTVGEGKVTALSVFDAGTGVRRDTAPAGRIARVWGLGDVRIGDTVGAAPAGPEEHRYFAPPSLETVVTARRTAERGALHAALAQLAEQDPLIDLRRDDVRQEIAVSLYGEVQKEVIQATLAAEFGLDVDFRQTTTIHIERPVGTGAAVEYIAKEETPFLATVGLRIEPGPVGSGVVFRLGVELGAMPYAFFAAVEDTVRRTLEQGLHGWRVTDCAVTMTHSGYYPRQSHAHGTFDKSMSSTGADFRGLTPLVLMDALRQAGTVVHEPMHRFRLDLPAEALGTLLPALARLGALPGTPTARDGGYEVEGDIPAARVHDLEQQLPTLTRGEGVLESAFHHYRPVAGAAPERPRTDHNPLHRREYLLQVQRRLAGLGGNGG
ncbi:ribosomal protection tetracycline resistance protein [Actinacidiphila yanglinensis]|uniref:Ribosomal protection tetracycline resistance protein n=1 Tax=Actinacidiphila yanglinensis TaxID=310779 RepID=A0A1H6DV94_9ACTN|nr:TetM/TetW/TetO/TetS family tetracycline resistance ribosomal protection protein [Actinacidiphila yanglinensis]SEG89267.1 ribosomal protection tetracycline resistance protein [Actinacidiphila yanglinensis]